MTVTRDRFKIFFLFGDCGGWSCKRNGKKWKRSDSFDSDFFELMTPLTTLIFDFHKVVSTLMTPTTIPTATLSLDFLKSPPFQ